MPRLPDRTDRCAHVTVHALLIRHDHLKDCPENKPTGASCRRQPTAWSCAKTASLQIETLPQLRLTLRSERNPRPHMTGIGAAPDRAKTAHLVLWPEVWKPDLPTRDEACDLRWRDR